MNDYKLMLVDDEERFLATTKKLLEKKGFNVVTAASGQEALNQLAEKKIHAVVLDVKMPGMDGIETLNKIKTRFPMVEVIMLTGHATVDTAVEGLKSGAIDYLMKPADIDHLIEKVKEAFQRVSRLEEKIHQAMVNKASQSSFSPM